jgi:TonB family protein
VNLQEHFDPKDYSGTGVEGGIATGMVPTGNEVFAENLVEEKPERLSGPPPVYPELLKQAQIQGRVLVQAVVDTLGRAEPNSIKILQSPNPGFDQPAKTLVLKSLFRPARVHGRAVRVQINIPIDFRITPGSK